jgi:hypothetical protein
MTLLPEDGKLFFELMWKLQYYVNQKHGFYTNITSRNEYADLPTEKKLRARDALWEHPNLIQAYVQENPDALPPEELEIIQKWTGFIKGSFFLLRHLKKGSIFIGGEGDKVYAVHGIQDPLEDVIPSYALPEMVLAILLPFKGQIIYDGLLRGYNIHIGGGIRSNLNHTYTVAKQKDRILTTLEPDLATPKIVKPKKNANSQLKDLAATIAKIKGDSPLQKSALTLARLCLGLSIADAEGTFTLDEIETLAHKIVKASSRLLNLLDIMEED